MELELGLKITKTREDVSSSVDFRFSKDPFGPLVLSRENDSRFIIIIHLKGFRKENIDIEINKEGNRITIRGRKPVEEMVLIRWMAWKKEVEFIAFKKVFIIPDIVDLDKIKARFDDDDATLTITMPKRVKGISGFQIEEEEEEERVEYGDVSEVENSEEVEEEDVEREESDEHSEKFETEKKREEEFGEIMENKERESQVLGEEEKGFTRSMDEEETEDEGDKILEFAEQETEDEQEPDEQIDRTSKTGATTDGDDGVSKVQKIEEPHKHNEESKIQEMVEEKGGEEKQKKKKIVKTDIRNEYPKEDVDAKTREGFTPNIDGTHVIGEDDIVETETKAEEFESDKTEADEVEKIHEVVENEVEEEENANVRRQSEDISLLKLQETEEQHSNGPKRHSKQEKMKELVEDDQTLDAEANITNDTPKQVQKMDAKEEADAKTGERFTPNFAETEKKEEETENAKVGTQTHDISLIKLQEKIKELVEEQTPEAEANKANNTRKSTQEKCEGKQKIQKTFLEETKNQPEEYKEKTMEKGKKIKREIIRQQELDEQAICEKESKTQELVMSKTNDEEKEAKEIAEMETKEHESYIPKILGKQEKNQELAEEKTSFSKNGKVKEDAEIAEKKNEFGDYDDYDDISRKVRDIEQQDSDKGEGFAPNISKEEEEDNAKVGRQSEDSSSIKKLQETEKQHDKQEKIKELVEEKTPMAETNIANEIRKLVQEIEEQEADTLETCEEKENADTETKEQESYRPKVLREQEKIQELAEERKNFSRKVNEEEEIAEKKTEFGDDDMSRKALDIEQRDSDATKGQEEKDKIQELVQEIDEKQAQEEATCGKQFEKLKGGEISGRREVEDEEKKTTGAEKIIRDIAREDQKIAKQDSDASGKYGQEDIIQKLQESRGIYRNEQEEEKKDKGEKQEKITKTKEQELLNLNSQLEQDNIEDGEKIRELVEAKTNYHKDEESEPKNDDDVVRKVQGIKETDLYGPKREQGSLRKVHSNEGHELYEPIHKERDKPRITGADELSCQDKKEKSAESMKIADSIDVQEKPEKQEVVEAGHNDHKEEQQEETVIGKKVLETEKDRLKKVQELEKHEYDELKRPMVQGRMQETEEDDKTRAMEEKEIVRRRKTEDGSLRKVRDDEDPELSKPYKRQEEDKIHELVEMGTSDYREKVKKHNGDDILKSQEGEIPNFERDIKRRNIPQLVEEEKMTNIAELVGKKEDDSSGKFEEPKSYEQQRETTEKEQVIGNAESTKKVQEFKKTEYDDMQRSIVQDRMQETEKKDKTRAGSLRKVREDEDPKLDRHKRPEEEDRIQEFLETETSDHREKVESKTGELERHCKEKKIHQSVEDEIGEGSMENISEPGGKIEGYSSGKFQKQNSYEDWRQKESKEIEDLVMKEATDHKDKHTGGEGEHGEERYKEVAETKTKVEDEINKKEPESDKQEQCRKLDKLEGVIRERASDSEKDENLVDSSTTEKEEPHESKNRETLDIVQDFVEEETGDQKERTEETAAVVTNSEKDSSRKLPIIKESEEHMEQNKIPETSDPKMKEAEERVAEKQTKVPEAHVQELEGNSEIRKEDHGGGRRGEKGKQGKTVETKIDDPIARKIRETKVQEKYQEPKDKIEEAEKKENNNHGVKLVTEEDSLRKGEEILEKELSNVLKRQPGEQEKIQELNEVENRDRVNEDEEKAEDEIKTNNGKSRKVGSSKMLELDESEENEEHKKIRKPVEEKANAPEKENKKIAEEEMQGEIDSRTKDQEIKRQEPYEKIPEPIFKGTTYHREEEKEMEEGEIEETKRIAEDGSSRKVQNSEAGESDGLEKHQKLNQWMKEKIKGQREDEMNEEGGYKAALKTKSMEDSSQSRDDEEKRSNQPKRYAEQELMAEEEGKEECDIREGEQKEKAKRILRVESEANEAEGHGSTRLRDNKKKENHQKAEEMKTSDQRNKEKEEETIDEYDSSRKIHEDEKRKRDEPESFVEEEMSDKLAEEEISDDKKGNRAEAEAKIRDDGFEEQGIAIAVRQRQKDKKQLFLEKDTSDKAKENNNREMKSRDDSSRKTQGNENQESHEQKRNYEEQDKKNRGTNYFRNEDGKEIADAEATRKLKNRDNIKELVDEKMKNHEGENKKRTITEVLAKSEGHEPKRPEELRKEDKNRELVQQRLTTDNLKDEETTKTKTKSKDNESRKIHQIREQETSEQERPQEQGRMKELVEDSRESDESTKPGRDEKGDKIQEPVDRETSEDDEIEVEFEESEEEWEAEIIQEMDSDKDNDKIRQLRRIKLGLFMSLIVIVIRFVHSKRKIRCYKF